LLYGPKFGAFSYAVPLALVSVVLWAAMFPFEMGLRVIRKPSKVVLSYSVSSAVVVATAWPAVHWAGLDGLLIALALANATGLVMCAWMLLRATGRVEKRDNVALTAVEGAS
jgi:O-antigen/teichoic acid export membrane protein